MFPPAFLFKEETLAKLGQKFLEKFVSHFCLFNRDVRNLINLLENKSSTLSKMPAPDEQLKIAFGKIFIEYVSFRDISKCLKRVNGEDYYSELIQFSDIAANYAGIEPQQAKTYQVFMEKYGKDINLFKKELDSFFKDDWNTIFDLLEGNNTEKLPEQSISNKIIQILNEVIEKPPLLDSQKNLKQYFEQFIQNSIIEIPLEDTRRNKLSLTPLLEWLGIEKNSEIPDNGILLLNLLSALLNNFKPPKQDSDPKNGEDFFKKLENLIEAVVTLSQQSIDKTILGVQPDTRGYVIHRIPGDGDCGYSCFNLTRKDAYHLISTALIQPQNEETKLKLKNLLKPALREALLLKKFYEYLKSKKVLNENLSFEDFERNTDQNLNDLSILLVYLEYDLLEKQESAGWAHPAVLQAIAYLKSIKLSIWRADTDGSLIPHHDQKHAEYTPEGQKHSPELNLLFHSSVGHAATANHFDVITIYRGGEGQNENVKLFPIQFPTLQTSQKETLEENEEDQFDPIDILLTPIYLKATDAILFLLSSIELTKIDREINFNLYAVETEQLIKKIKQRQEPVSHFNGTLKYVLANISDPNASEFNMSDSNTKEISDVKNWIIEKIDYLECEVLPQYSYAIKTIYQLLNNINTLFIDETTQYVSSFIVFFKDNLKGLLGELSNFLQNYYSFNDEQSKTIDNQINQNPDTEQGAKYLTSYLTGISDKLDDLSKQVKKISESIGPSLKSLDEPFNQALNKLSRIQRSAYREIKTAIEGLITAYLKIIEERINQQRITIDNRIESLNTHLLSFDTTQLSPPCYG